MAVDSPVPLMHHDPDRSWITDSDPDHPKGTYPYNIVLQTGFININTVKTSTKDCVQAETVIWSHILAKSENNCLMYSGNSHTSCETLCVQWSSMYIDLLSTVP